MFDLRPVVRQQHTYFAKSQSAHAYVLSRVLQAVLAKCRHGQQNHDECVVLQNLDRASSKQKKSHTNNVLFDERLARQHDARFQALDNCEDFCLRTQPKQRELDEY